MSEFNIDILYFDGGNPTMKREDSLDDLFWNLIVMYNNDDFEGIAELKKLFGGSEDLLSKFGAEAINFMMSEMANFCNKHSTHNKFTFDPNTRTRKIKPTKLPIYKYPMLFDNVVALISELAFGKVDKRMLNKLVVPKLLNEFVRYEDVRAGLDFSVSSSDEVGLRIDEILLKYPDKVAEYRDKGKLGVANMFFGELMRTLGGKCDPKSARKMLYERLGG